MFSPAKDWNPKQKELNFLLLKLESFNQAIALCLYMHNQLHNLNPDNGENNIYRELITDLTPEKIKFRPPKSFASIAWDLWHITRIEDAAANILIANGEQVFNENWKTRIKSPVTDTGNAFAKEDVDNFSSKIDAIELINYRKAVGLKTREILENLKPADLKKKPNAENLDRLEPEGVLTAQKDSIWLRDFWAGKTAAGLITMPITRHQAVHINDCFKLKENKCIY